MLTEGFPPVYVEAWGVTEAFRRLGYATSEMRFYVGPCIGLSGDQVCVELLTQGREFRVWIGAAADALEQVFERLDALQNAVRAAEESVSHDLWLATSLGSDEGRFMMLAEALMQSGFFIPKLVN